MLYTDKEKENSDFKPEQVVLA